MSTIQTRSDKHMARVKKVSEGIVKAFREKFPGEEPEPDFETCWPLSCHDMIHSPTRSFAVTLHMVSGRVKDITEEF